jgi:hypothetical protein
MVAPLLPGGDGSQPGVVLLVGLGLRTVSEAVVCSVDSAPGG